MLAREKFTEARLFISYINPALPHRGTLALYSEPSREDLYDNIFQGDVTEMEFDLDSMGHAHTNGHFINSLIESISPHWRYMSRQRSFGFDKEGFDDVTARFDIEDLKKALPGQWAM